MAKDQEGSSGSGDPTQPSSTADNKVAGAISYAQAQLGKPYCWGGTGPSCYDCSGLWYMAYKSVGVNITRTTYSQIAALIAKGQIVSTAGNWQDSLQPGDLIYAVPVPGDEHVVGYIGGGQVLQAPQTGQTVFTAPLAEGFPWKPLAIRRPVPTSTASGVSAAQDSGSSTTASGDCLVPFLFGACLLGRAQGKKLLGGLILAGSAVLALGGLALTAKAAGAKLNISTPKPPGNPLSSEAHAQRSTTAQQNTGGAGGQRARYNQTRRAPPRTWEPSGDEF